MKTRRRLGAVSLCLAITVPLSLWRMDYRPLEKNRKAGIVRTREPMQEQLRARYQPLTPTAPQIVHVSRVAPDVVGVTVDAGRVIPGSLTRYTPQAGDTKEKRGEQVLLKRNGKEVGWLIGPSRDWLVAYESFTGDPLLEFLADKPESWRVNGEQPQAVYRKSKPMDWEQPGRRFAMRHQIYLKLAKPLTAGETATISAQGINLRTMRATLPLNPAKVRSEAVHVNQVGYRPDDPVKQGFLSVWLGTGGPCAFPPGLGFQVVEEAMGKAVLTGRVEQIWRQDQPEQMHRLENFSKTNIYRLDFSALNKPGKYRLVVEDVGCSYPFEIAPDVWAKAFKIQMRGLYNQRSGVALAPPYADYTKPRDFHPADGLKVYQSRYSVLDGASESPELAKQSTGELLPNAWGGYHDAGDWNPRRVTHMRVTMAQLELRELFPAYFRSLKLNLPPTKNVPDVLAEALFEIDCFRRLQKPDGGIPFGIETNGDPVEGEVSWLQSFDAFVFAPDPWSGYVYAGVAGRAAKLLLPTAPDLAKVYRESAVRAMTWAETDRTRRVQAGTWGKVRWEVKDDRNLAAVVLYDLTGDRKYHTIFEEDTCLKDTTPNLFVWGKHVQRDAAFAYARLAPAKANPELQKKAVAALEAQAQQALTYAAGNAFNLTTPDKGKPMFLGFFSTPDAIELARVHYLTQKPEYLAGVVRATQFSLGANPNNMTYTTGLGANPPRNPLFLDTRRTGQPTPVGVTIYGNCDYVGWRDNSFFTWPVTYFLGTACTPSAWDWPLTEAYFDIFLYPAKNEWTVDIWDKTVYTWGYLAARK